MIPGKLFTRPLRAILAAFLLAAALSASAAVPGAWSGRSCTSCHGNPTAQMSLWPNTGLRNLPALNLPSTAGAFIGLLNAPQPPGGLAVGTMESLAADATPQGVQDREMILQYLFAVRDGKVKAMVGAFERDTLTFSQQVIGATPQTGVVRITNERNVAMSYSASIDEVPPPGTSPSYTVALRTSAPAPASPSCTETTVPALSVCDLTITFNPRDGADGARLATLKVELPSMNSVVSGPREIQLSGSAAAAEQGRLEFAPFPMFPATERSSSSTREIELHNNGTGTLTFESKFTPVGDFTPSGECTEKASLDKNTFCILKVTFTPSDLGERKASLTIRHNGFGGSSKFDFDGTGVERAAPRVKLLPATELIFGNQTVGGLFEPRPLSLSNDGNATLSITSISVGGAAFTDASSPACPPTLEPGQPCNIKVLFSPPAALASYEGFVRIVSNADGSPHTVVLKGNGVGSAVPVLTWAGAARQLDLGSVSVGMPSALQSVTLFNNGPGGVRPSLINSIGTDAAMFAVVSDPADITTCQRGRVVYQGSSCRIDLRFSPGGSGARSAILQVASEGSPPPTMVLAGVGLSTATPGMRLTPTALTLDNTRVGSVSAPGEVTIQSAGAGPLSVQGIAVSGPFTVSNKTCPATPFSLAAGAACTVTVAFAPQSEGAASGNLTINSDATPRSQAVALSAQAEPRARDSGGGGCSMTTGRSPTDPTLWALVVLAFAALCIRQRRRNHRRTSPANADARQP